MASRTKIRFIKLTAVILIALVASGCAVFDMLPGSEVLAFVRY